MKRQKEFFRRFSISLLTAATLGSLGTMMANACTRAVYIGADDIVITARSMDWNEDMRTNLWAFPRGIQRDGAAGPNSVKWTSRYGSVIASSYDLASTDGMNEKGLVANLLYLTASDYGKPGDKPTMSLSLWAQYVLDNFATVDEAVNALEREPFRLITAKTPGGGTATLHLSISDASGNSGIFEYIDGTLVIHHGKQYQVMTNEPQFRDQLALTAYWERIGGLTFLPGTSNGTDRFVRTSFLIKAIPKTLDKRYIATVPGQSYRNQALASTLGVIRSVSVPLGITTPNQPNISSTIWRTIADHKNKVYFFDSATNPNTFWVDFKEIDFNTGAPVKKLTLTGGAIYSGSVAKQFEASKSFEFMRVTP